MIHGVRVDAEQYRDAIQVQQEGEDDAENRVQAEHRREAEEDAERKRRRGALGRVVDVEQVAQPAADEVSRQLNHSWTGDADAVDPK